MTYSYSSIKTYEQCPQKFKFGRIDKLPEPSGEAAERGKALHSAIEANIKGETNVLPIEIEHIRSSINELKTMNAVPEKQFAIDIDWKPVTFFSKKARFRGVIDIYAKNNDKAIVLDWKSGKVRDYSDQVRTYAAVSFAIDEELQAIKPIIAFIDQKKEVEYPSIPREVYPSLRAEIERRMSKIDNDTVYAPNPGILCKWCHYRKDNGGPCQW
jgi:CRISPR/Cas system-associated exonuclease Cas4 (RecB family)